MRYMGILTFENSFVVLEICDVGKVALSHTVLICRHRWRPWRLISPRKLRQERHRYGETKGRLGDKSENSLHCPNSCVSWACVLWECVSWACVSWVWTSRVCISSYISRACTSRACTLLHAANRCT